MASSLFLTLILTSTIAATATAAAGNYKEKTTKLHFYLHEMITGPNPTARLVVQPLNNNSIFGQIGVVDDEVRLGPKATSKLIGRVQGLDVGSSLRNSGILVAGNFVFTEGQYNGSTLAIFGRLDRVETTFELSIIGGSGEFRMARGYAIFCAVSPPPPAGTIIYEVDALVLHH